MKSMGAFMDDLIEAKTKRSGVYPKTIDLTLAEARDYVKWLKDHGILRNLYDDRMIEDWLNGKVGDFSWTPNSGGPMVLLRVRR